MKNKKGFTTVELVLVLAILGVMAFLLSPTMLSALRSYDIIQSRKELVNQGRAAMERMAAEISYIQSASDVVDVSSSTSFQFEYPDGTPITYSLSGTSLMRGADILADNISSLTFTYYDGTGATTSTAANVRRIKIGLVLDDPGDHGTLSLSTQVFLRNTGNEFTGFVAN